MIVVGTTLPTMAVTAPDDGVWNGWLRNAELLRERTDDDVRFFAAIQLDGRGLDPFAPLLDRLAELGGEHWTFTLDDGRSEITMTNRWRHITVGQNLVMDYAMSTHASHLLFMAADTEYPPGALTEMIGLNHSLVGGHVPTYGLTGPIVGRYVHSHGEQIREHMASAAFVLLHRDLFRFVRWRWDVDAGMSDDPCLQLDAMERGVPTYVHHGVIGRHYPVEIGDYRSRGFDVEVR